jgi:DNA-binding transcriptional LysR family regulator
VWHSYVEVVAELETRELRYFLVVAEELNFSRAAERLGVAQPPLSRAIRQLEHKLGVRLFERTTRQVELTPAGRVLLTEAQVALEAVEAAARLTQRAVALNARLLVAVKAGEDTALLAKFVDRYEADGGNEAAPVDVVVSGWGQPHEMVLDGRAELALVRDPFNRRGLEVEPLVTEERVVLMPADHRLAHRLSLRLAELVDEPIPLWRGADETLTAYWEGRDDASRRGAWAGEQLGVVSMGPRTPGPEVGDISQLVEVVSLSQAIAFVPVSVAVRMGRPGIIHRTVRDLSPSTTSLVWRARSSSLAIRTFATAAARVVAQRSIGPRQPASGRPR